MTVIAGACYRVVSAGGTSQQGSILTRSNAAHKRLHLYPNQVSGHGAPVLEPGDLRDLARMTWAGYLNASNKAAVAGLCAIAGTPDFGTNLVASISALTIIYGDPVVGAFQTTECFGTRLRLTGRSGQLVRFSVEMVGKATTATTVTAPAIADAEFFPFEKGTHGIGDDTLLGFDVDYRTGFFARFAPDGELGYSGINESLRQRALAVTLYLAHNAASYAEWADYAAITRADHTLTLSGSDGSTCVIAVGGYYEDWDYREQNKLLVAKAVLRGVWDDSTYISMN